jgi:hypothetical protein
MTNHDDLPPDLSDDVRWRFYAAVRRGDRAEADAIVTAARAEVDQLRAADLDRMREVVARVEAERVRQGLPEGVPVSAWHDGGP